MPEVKRARQMWNNFLDRVQLSSHSKVRGSVGCERVACTVELPAETFECFDECAGYFVSRVSVVPRGVTIIDDCIGELLRIGVNTFRPWSLATSRRGSQFYFTVFLYSNAERTAEKTVRRQAANQNGERSDRLTKAFELGEGQSG